MATRSSSGRRRPLNRDRVLRAAVAMADRDGLEALSMRRLGHNLGVEAMALYNHVKNKDDLLDGVTNLVLGEIELPATADWRADIRRHATSAHEVFSRHPWACQLSLSPKRVVPASVQRADWILRRLREAGFNDRLTYHAYHALDAHILGYTLWQAGHTIADEKELAEVAGKFLHDYSRHEYPDLHEHTRQHIDGFGSGQPGAFELVLDLLLEGLESRVGASA